MAKNEKFSYGDIKKALIEEGGNITRAAKRLGASRRAIYYRIEKAKRLGTVVDTERQAKSELRLDLAERNLDNDLEAGRWRATEYVLSTLGKKRGYSRQGSTGKDATPEDNRQSTEDFIKDLDDQARAAGLEITD